MSSNIVQFGYEVKTIKKGKDGQRCMQLIFKYRFRDKSLNEDEEGIVLQVFDVDGEAAEALQNALNEVKVKPRIGFR